MLPASTLRLSRHTPSSINERIRRQMEERIAYYAAHTGLIGRRLEELDREWDSQRVLESNAASAALAGMALGAVSNRKWFVVPAIVAGFLLQHAMQGWCPPLSLIRRFGVRTPAEIDQERYALKALRGDFDGVNAGREASDSAARAAIVLRAIDDGHPDARSHSARRAPQSRRRRT